VIAPLVLSAGHQLRDRAGALAEAVVAREFSRFPRMRARYGTTGRAQLRQDVVHAFSYLADSVDVGSPALFNDYVAWARLLGPDPDEHGEDLENRLLCMGDVVREQMPPRVAAPTVALLEGTRAALPAMPSTSVSFLDAKERLSPLADAYVGELLGGYRQAAARLLFDAAGRGEPIRELYLRVLQPALREIGRLWQLNSITSAQEHFCSAATQVLMSQLVSQARTEERCGRSVVVVCVSGDRHEVGARMVADFFEMAGWDAYFCGANTPHAAAVKAVVDRAADVLAISATMGYRVHAVQDLITAARAEPGCAGLRILVGGHPFNVDQALWRTVGADGTAADAEGAVARAAGWPRRPAAGT
jgi:methanogenic corrinoid protein MtbC1